MILLKFHDIRSENLPIMPVPGSHYALGPNAENFKKHSGNNANHTKQPLQPPTKNHRKLSPICAYIKSTNAARTLSTLKLTKSRSSMGLAKSPTVYDYSVNHLRTPISSVC